MSVKINRIAEGDKFDLYEIIHNGSSLIQDFISGLDDTARDKVFQRLEFIADHGAPRDKRKFRKERDGIFSIKVVEHAVRILCFYEKNKIIILTHGFFKDFQGGHRLDRQIDRATRLRGEYQQGKGKEQ